MSVEILPPPPPPPPPPLAPSQKIELMKIKQFEQNLPFMILTSRFNNYYWEKNRQFRIDNNIKCIYGTPVQISNKIPYNRKCVVLEMNNDTNKIMGIGLIINYPFYNKYKIYKNGNDRYIYKSNKYFSFQNIQIPNPNPNPDPTSFKIEELQLTIDVLEQLCFYGNEHLKRGSGLQIFPIKYLYRLREHLNIVKILSDLFEINTNEPARTQ